MNSQKLSQIFIKIEEQSDKCTRGLLPAPEKQAYIRSVLRFMLELQIEVIGNEKAFIFLSLRPETQVATRYLEDLHAELSVFFNDFNGNIEKDTQRILSFLREETHAKKIKQETLPINIAQYDPAFEELVAYHRPHIRLMTLAKMAGYCLSGLAADDYDHLNKMLPPQKAALMMLNCYTKAQYFQHHQPISPGQSNLFTSLSGEFFQSSQKDIRLIYAPIVLGEISDDTLFNEVHFRGLGISRRTISSEKSNDSVASVLLHYPNGLKYEQYKNRLISRTDMENLHQLDFFSLSHLATPSNFKVLLNSTLICPGEYTQPFFSSANSFWLQADQIILEITPLLEKISQPMLIKNTLNTSHFIKKYKDFAIQTVTKVCQTLQGIKIHRGIGASLHLTNLLLPFIEKILQEHDSQALIQTEATIKQCFEDLKVNLKVDLKVELRAELNSATNLFPLLTKESDNDLESHPFNTPPPFLLDIKIQQNIKNFCDEVLDKASQWQISRGKKIQWHEHMKRIIIHQLNTPGYGKFTPDKGMNPTTYQIMRDINAHPDTAARTIFLVALKYIKKTKSVQSIDNILEKIQAEYQQSNKILKVFSDQKDFHKMTDLLSANLFINKEDNRD